MDFNIYAQIHKELDDFFTEKIKIAGTKQEGESVRYLSKQSKNYEFSQWETINLIDLYYNSKFESGALDSENQRKIFLNICRFRADVASKQIDLDVKNFNYVPTDGGSKSAIFGCDFMSREFRDWAKENYFGEYLNTNVEKFPRYGWVVSRKIKGGVEDVPLQILRNQQDAECLNKASFVILEHAKMTRSEMEDMPAWKTDELKIKGNETADVFERYGKVPRALLNEFKGMPVSNDDWDDWVEAVAICTAEKNTEGKYNGNILYLEESDRDEFEEERWARQHGRLMGIGEIENQIENQVGANIAFNLFRRQLLWSSKKIFQSMDDGIAKNLVRDVKDGTVLQVGVNGQITQVDMGNRALADFNAFNAILEKNSDQKSFTYEVATGESLPSGTPFRLGVVLSNAVNSHFDLKREKLGLFMKRVVEKFVEPEFKKAVNREHILSLFSDEEGFEALKQIVRIDNENRIIKDELLAGRMPNIDKIKQDVERELNSSRFISAHLNEEFYDSFESRLTLTITGEEIDLPKKIETLTNLYTQLAQRQDPRADKILKRILAYAGENFDVLVGIEPAQQQIPQQQQAIPSPVQPSTLNQPTTPNMNL